MAFGDADASSPPFVAVSSGSVATTASFTPPAGSVLQVVDYHDTASGNTTNSSAITDSLGLTWTAWAVRAKPDSGAQNARVALWTAVASGAAMTVTTTGTNCAGACGLSVRVVTGADTTTPVDVVAEGSNTGALISLGITTVTDGARGFLAATDWNVAANMTAGANQTAVRSQGIGSGPDIRIYLGVQNAVTSPPALVTMSTATPTAANTNNYLAWALRPAAGGGPTPISVGDTGSTTETLTATATSSPADSGSAADTVTVAASTALADTGTAGQTLGVTATSQLADAGAGTQTITVTATAGLADTATAAEALTAAGALTLADGAAAADALATNVVTSLADAGTAGQTLTVAAAVALTDSGSATDALLAGIGIFPTDSAAAADTLAVTAGVPLADAGTGADVFTASAGAGLADTANAVDSLAVTVAVALSDAGSASDALDHVILVLLGDSGSASDALTVDGAASVIPAAYVRTRTTTGHHRTSISRPWHRTGTHGPRS